MISFEPALRTLRFRRVYFFVLCTLKACDLPQPCLVQLTLTREPLDALTTSVLTLAPRRSWSHVSTTSPSSRGGGRYSTFACTVPTPGEPVPPTWIAYQLFGPTNC